MSYSHKKQFRGDLDEADKTYLLEVCKKTGLSQAKVLGTLLDLNKDHNLLEPNWISKLWNTEVGEKLKKELTEKIARDSNVQSIAEVNHNCIYVCPFISDKSSNLTFCMCEWSSKKRIIKVTTQWCNICFEKGYVIPRPKTEAELREEDEIRARQRREEMRRATTNVGSQSFHNYSRPKGAYEKFRDPQNG